MNQVSNDETDFHCRRYLYVWISVWSFENRRWICNTPYLHSSCDSNVYDRALFSVIFFRIKYKTLMQNIWIFCARLTLGRTFCSAACECVFSKFPPALKFNRIKQAILHSRTNTEILWWVRQAQKICNEFLLGCARKINAIYSWRMNDERQNLITCYTHMYSISEYLSRYSNRIKI